MVPFLALLTWGVLGLAAPLDALGHDLGARDTPKLANATMSAANGSVAVQGFSFNGVDAYVGIPYAQPPIQALRFKPPKPAEYGKELSALKVPPACIQDSTSAVSEDCLYLNILTPLGAAGRSASGIGLPVMVFIHGGGYYSGSGMSYLSEPFVTYGQETGRPFVLVTFNYRLGVLGFGTGEDVAKAGAANLGMRDQLLALQWVQEHISSFGGDPSKVTVFGQSAGAMSIGLHMLSGSGTGLFQAAIMHSGAPSSLPLWNTSLAPAGPYHDLAAAAGCKAPNTTNLGTDDTWGCLARTPAATLKAAGKAAMAKNKATPFIWGPSVDGDVVKESPQAALRAGNIANIPFIVGNVRDEGTFLVDKGISADAELAPLLSALEQREVNKTFASAVEKAYPDNPAGGSPFDTGDETFNLTSKFKQVSAIMGDLVFQRRRRDLLEAASLHNVTQTWTYEWEATSPNAPPYKGIAHNSDMSYLFGHALSSRKYSAEEVAAGRELMSYWLNFAYFQNPNGNATSTGERRDLVARQESSTGPHSTWWPQHDLSSRSIMFMEPGNFHVGEDTYRDDQMAVFNEDVIAQSLGQPWIGGHRSGSGLRYRPGPGVRLAGLWALVVFTLHIIP